MVEAFLINGRVFVLNDKDQKVDEDGFFTSKWTNKPVGGKFVCVSVKISDDKVQIRDTKDTTKTTLTFDYAEWRAFLRGVRDGEFDLKS